MRKEAEGLLVDTRMYEGAMQRFNRREALRFAVPLVLSPMSLLSAAHRAEAGPSTEISLKATESVKGWSDGVKTAVDDTGKPAIIWTTSAGGSVANLNYALGTRTMAVAHARQLRFRYRVEGAAATLHFKIVAAPLASGFQAVYRLPFPKPGVWREAVIPVQEYNTVWGATGTPQTKDGGMEGSLQVRLTKTAGADVSLTIGEIWLDPLPKTTPVNTTADPNTKKGVLPAAPDALKPLGLVTPKVQKSLAGLAHPRLLLTASDITSLRSRAQTTSEGRELLAALTKRGDEFLGRAVQVPERGGQWDRWYVCPKHGRTLRAEGPRRHVCSVDGEVFTGYPYDDVLLTKIHQGYAETVRDLGMLFQTTGDARCAAKAREILMAYAEKYHTFPLHDISNKPILGGGRIMAQSAAEAQWLILVAQGCDMVWDTLTPADRDTLRSGLFYPAVVDVIQKHDTGIEGDQCWRNSAVGLTGLLFGDMALLSDAMDNGERGLQAQIERGVTKDGFWYEQRWDYHFEAMNALMPLAEAAQNVGINVYGGTLGERYKRLYLLPIEMAMPNHFLPAFNDSRWDTADGNPLYETAYARWGDPLLSVPIARMNKERRSAAALRFATAPLDAPAPPLKSANFPDAGYAILRAGDAANPAYLAVKYGPDGGVHGHPDKLSFVFWSQNRLLFDDPGPTVRGSSMETNWHKTTFAHNTLVVDEENQKPAAGKCLDFLTGASGSAILADAGEIYEGIRYRRAVFLLNEGTAVLLDVALATDNRIHTFDFVLHPSSEWASPLPPTGASGMQKPGYQFLRDVVTTTTFENGAAAFDLLPIARVAIATPATTSVRLMRGNGLGESGGEKTGTPCLITRHTGTSAASQASLLMSGPQSASGKLRAALVTNTTGNAQHDALAVYAEFGGKRCLLLANPEAATVRVGSDYRGSDRLAIIPLKSA